MIPKVDEDHAAVVPDTVNPAGKPDAAPHLFLAEFPAGVRAINTHS